MTDDESAKANCYVGRMPGCRCIGSVVVDSKEHAKDTAKSVAEMIRSGLQVESMTVGQFREGKDQFGCAHELKMKECRKRGMNKAAA